VSVQTYWWAMPTLHKLPLNSTALRLRDANGF
jgi:hypothetical protein